MLRIIKDRYRPLFCSSDFYSENKFVFDQWNQLFKNLSSIEKIQAWVVALSLLRRPTDWYGGLRKQKRMDPSCEKHLRHPITLQQLVVQNSNLAIPFSLQNFNLFQVINEVYIKAIPETALRALTFFTNQTYPLEIVQYVPTPQELLTFQLQGKRIISFNENIDSWTHTLYHGRDFLSFIIHDLIHADHFFSNPNHRAGQLGFYRCIQAILEQTTLLNFLKNAVFKEAFEYIISDMNSHPIHLFKTLKARVLQVVKNDSKANSIWESWTLIWSREDSAVNSALQKINTQLFSDKDALEISEWCIALGHNSRLA